MLKALLILPLILSNSLVAWRPYRLIHVNLTAYSSNEKVITFNATISNNDAINTYLEVKQTIQRPFARVEYYIDSGDGKFAKYLNETVDVCRFFRYKNYLPLIHVIYNSMIEQAKYPKSCPLTKKSYSGKNVKVDIEKLPPTLPEKILLFSIFFMEKEGKNMKELVVFKLLTKILNVAKDTKFLN